VDGMTAGVHLSTEQRRALALLIQGQRGLTEATLMHVHGFTSELLANLVHNGLAEVAPGTTRTGGRTIEVERMRITSVGRKAIDSAVYDWE
jgi:hypothetical protein